MTRLLYADASPTLAHGVQLAMERRGLAVETVCDGYLALLRLQLGLHDVCLMDSQLPTLDGLSALKKARASGVSLPIVILCASDTASTRSGWFDAGADDVLHKPFDPDELCSRIRSLHQRCRPQRDTAIHVGALKYDLMSESFSLNGAFLPFTPKESKFVQSLISRPGHVAPKDRVFRLVFGGDAVGQGAIDVLACRVRRKLQGSGVSVVTIRGMGYMLKEDRV